MYTRNTYFLRDRSLQQAPYDYWQQIIKTLIILINDKITFSQHRANYFILKNYILVYLEQNAFLHNVCHLTRFQNAK